MFDADRRDPAVLQAVAVLSTQGRACYGSNRIDRVIWFLEREAWVLDELQRYAEAETLVTLFYDRYAEQASDFYKARFAIKKQRLRSLQGDLVGEAIAFQQAQQYRHAMPPEAEVAHLLNGVSIYRDTDDWEHAFELIREARALVEDDETRRTSYARTLVVEAETLLKIEEAKTLPVEAPLLRARELMLEGKRLYREEEEWERYSIACITLGRIEVLLGDPEAAFALFHEAETRARARADERTVIVANLRRGEALRRLGQLDAAEAHFTAGLALADSADLHEHELDLLLGLAQTHQDQDDLAAAQRLYRRVLDIAPAGARVAEVRAAQERAREALLRVIAASEHNAGWWHAVGVLLFLMLVGGGYLFYRRRPSAKAHPVALDDLLNQTLFSPLDAGDSLMNRRLACIRQVLVHPERVLPEIEDPMLRRLVQRGPEHNTDLFLCAAALEERATGRTFENDPANTLGRYLRQEFKTRHIPWPQTPEAWRRLLDAPALRGGPAAPSATAG